MTIMDAPLNRCAVTTPMAAQPAGDQQPARSPKASTAAPKTILKAGNAGTASKRQAKTVTFCSQLPSYRKKHSAVSTESLWNVVRKGSRHLRRERVSRYLETHCRRPRILWNLMKEVHQHTQLRALPWLYKSFNDLRKSCPDIRRYYKDKAEFIASVAAGRIMQSCAQSSSLEETFCARLRECLDAPKLRYLSSEKYLRPIGEKINSAARRQLEELIDSPGELHKNWKIFKQKKQCALEERLRSAPGYLSRFNSYLQELLTISPFPMEQAKALNDPEHLHTHWLKAGNPLRSLDSTETRKSANQLILELTKTHPQILAERD